MITRSAKKRNVNSECNTLAKSSDKSEMNVYECALSKLSQSDIQLDKEKCQKSILNVHIQMPKKCEIGNINLFVPGFQPIVHFHFNEEPKNLKVFVGKNNGEEGHKIQLYNKSNLENENSLEFETKRLSRSYHGEIAGEDAIGIENYYKNVVGNNSNSKNCSNYKTNGNEDVSNGKNNKNEVFEFNESISNWSLFKHDAKLTKAVVVVHDIFRKKDNQIARSQERRNGNKVSKSIDVPLAKGDSVENSGQIIGSCSTNATHKTIDNKNCKILTKLAEGYNFSEILSRFRFNYGSYIADSSGSLKVPKSENSSESPVKGEGELQKTENFNESLVDKNQGLKFSTSNLGEDLNKVGGLLAPSCEEIVESTDSGGSILHGLVQNTKCRDSREDAENLRDQFQDSDMKTDANESATLVASGSGRIFACQETVDSSNVTSEVVDNENCNISEIGVNSNFGVITGEMEMKTKNVNKNNKKLNKGKETKKKKKKSKSQITKPSRSSRAKKMKESNEMPQKTLSKGVKSGSLDYIPLQASGPTEFGVSMLNKILPFERHDARDFKNRMLFGERVTRYSSSQEMRMYKLKQETVRHVKESSKK